MTDDYSLKKNGNFDFLMKNNLVPSHTELVRTLEPAGKCELESKKRSALCPRLLKRLASGKEPCQEGRFLGKLGFQF